MPIFSRSVHLTPVEETTISAGFAAYNEPHAGTGDRQPFVLTLNAEGGGLIAALEAVTFYNWASINRLWVAEKARGQGIGTQLMLEAERIALERQCIGAYLNTFDFQARGFYEKLGFQVFGTLEDCPVGHQRFFMQKRFEYEDRTTGI